MKIKKFNKFLTWILPEDTTGITLAPFGIYLKESSFNDESTRNHEKIHWKQQIEMLVLFFYIWYLIEWGIRIITQGFKQAYYHISFEQEAYSNEDDENFLKTRKHYFWIKYL